MSPFQIFAAVLTLSAAFAYVNQRSLRLPPAIGIMAMSLALSLLLIVLGRVGLVPVGPLAAVVKGAELGPTLLHGMLGALLFAGALHVDLGELRRERAAVLGLSLVGTLISTALVGGSFYLAAGALGVRSGRGTRSSSAR